MYLVSIVKTTCHWPLLLTAIRIGLCESQTSFTEYPRDNIAILEGGTLTTTCAATTTPDEERLSVIWYLNDGSTETIIAINKTLSGGTMATVGSDYRSPLTLSNINRVWNGTTIHCAVNPSIIVNQPEPFPIISVWFPPSITPPITNKTVIEGTSFTTPLTITGDPFPVSSNIAITKDGVTVQDGRISVNIESGNGASSFIIQNIKRTDSGSYTVNVTTIAGSGTTVVDLNVNYPPEFLTVLPNLLNIVQRNKFTFNCTPSAANPPPSSYVFERDGVDITEGVSGSILNVSSLKRSEHSGNYTCTVTNKAGSVTIATYLNVLGPSSVPQDITFDDVGPFSVTLSWQVPSDNGGTRQPLSYTVRVINDTVNLPFRATSTQMTLTMDDGIWHSSMYSVTVVAANEYGVSPPAASTFITPDSVPIIESVSVEALSLTILSVDVVLLTDGGQNVDNYTVVLVLIGSNYSFVENILLSTELTIKNLVFMFGQKFEISVTATNSVGESDSFQSNFTVNDKTAAAIPATQGYIPIVVGVIGAVLVILLAITFILLIGRYWRHKTRSQDVHQTKQNKETVYEDVDSKEVDLQPNPSYLTVSSPLSSSGLSCQVQGPVYEECEMRDRVVIEENPAYGVLAKPTEYSNL